MKVTVKKLPKSFGEKKTGCRTRFEKPVSPVIGQLASKKSGVVMPFPRSQTPTELKARFVRKGVFS